MTVNAEEYTDITVENRILARGEVRAKLISFLVKKNEQLLLGNSDDPSSVDGDRNKQGQYGSNIYSHSLLEWFPSINKRAKPETNQRPV
jgi:hypothetical protein